MAATIEISIPDALLQALGAEPVGLSRQAIEALVARAYRCGKLTHEQAGEILGLDRWQTDHFLKSEQAHRPSETREFAGDLEQIRRIGR